MHDQVRVAADRRGEMAVGGAAEPGVTAVALAVGGLFEGTQHERCIRVAAVPASRRLARHQPARLRGQLGGFARCRRAAQRRRRDLELVQLRDQPLDPRRVGLGVDPVDRRHALALQQLGDLLVGEDHQPLDQAVRLGLGDTARADDVAARVEAELGLEGLDVEAGRAAPLAQRRGRLAGDRQRLGDRFGRFRPPREDDVQLVVVEPRVGADAAAVEARAAGLTAGPQLDLRRHGEALHPRCQAAGLLAQRVRQHRLDCARHVGAVAAAPRLAVERRARRHVGSDVGDVDPEPGRLAFPPRRDGVVEIACGGRIDGEGRQLGQVAAGTAARLRHRPGLGGFELQRRRKAAPAQLLLQQRLDRLARGLRHGLPAPPAAPPLPVPVVAPVRSTHARAFPCALCTHGVQKAHRKLIRSPPALGALAPAPRPGESRVRLGPAHRGGFPCLPG